MKARTRGAGRSGSILTLGALGTMAMAANWIATVCCPAAKGHDMERGRTNLL
jgi:hypothetical protein